MWPMIKAIDTDIFFLINMHWKNGLFDVCMPIIANSLYVLIPVAIFWLALILKKDIKTRTAALVILAVVATSDIVSAHVLKPFFQRPRPYHVLSGIHYYRNEWRVTPDKMKVSTSTNFSMPSSHATNVFAAAVFLSWYFPSYAWLYLLVALIVSYTRPYTGMHYPLDVAAGAAVGGAIGSMYALVSTAILQRIKERKAGTASPSVNGKQPGPGKEGDNGG